MKLLKQHWRFLITVGIVLFINLYRYSNEIYIRKLETLKVTCLDDITICNRRYCHYNYSIRSKEYQALFTIQSAVNFVIENEEDLKNILSGDKIEIGISKKDIPSLNVSTHEIPIYLLKNQDRLFFDSTDYLVGQAKQNRRILILSLLGLTLFAFFYFKELRRTLYVLTFVGIVITALVLLQLKII